MKELTPIINAAGKLTALGGSVQSNKVTRTLANTAGLHVDLAEQRAIASARIAEMTGAENACITSGAAAGIAISVAAVLSGTNLELIQLLPHSNEDNHILLQAGHAINFGAPVEQMIRIGGGMPWIVGSTNMVSEEILISTLENETFAAMLYVKSHHCVQTNQVPLARCIDICHQYDTPVIIDAAAEEDLTYFIGLGADLVTYSGGKAFCGPTCGFIVGQSDLIRACEMQSQGIARTMKVGKETIAGLMVALDEYVSTSESDRLSSYDLLNDQLISRLQNCNHLNIQAKPDEAGRPFSRTAISVSDATASSSSTTIKDLVAFLKACRPSIRTRNHHLDDGYLLIDPREVSKEQMSIIADCILQFDQSC